MAVALWEFFGNTGEGTSRIMGSMVARGQSAVHRTSRSIVSSGVGHSNKLHSGICSLNDIGVFLFRCHAYGTDSTRAAVELTLCAMDEAVYRRVLLGSDTSLRGRDRRVEARCSLLATGIEVVSDESDSNSLDGGMAVPDPSALGHPIPGARVLALVFGAGEFGARTLGQRMVDLVISVHRTDGQHRSAKVPQIECPCI